MMRNVLVLISAGALLVMAQERGPQPRPVVVRATGEAAAPVHADQTSLRLSVFSTGGNARAKNAKQITEMIASLRQLLGPDANIRTVDYTADQNRNRGYVANVIEVHVADAVLAGKAIDLAAKSGARVSDAGSAPSELDEQTARVEALKQATVRARANAEAIAVALGLRVVRVVSAETVAQDGVAPLTRSEFVPNVALEKRAVVTTPVEPGTMKVRAQVCVTVEVAP